MIRAIACYIINIGNTGGTYPYKTLPRVMRRGAIEVSNRA